MNLFAAPEGLELVSHFKINKIMVSKHKDEAAFQEGLRVHSGLKPGDGDRYEWFTFNIVFRMPKSWRKTANTIPHCDNIPRLIVSAFKGLLYPEKNAIILKGIQVEADFSPDQAERTEVWIFGKPVLK